MIIVEIVSNSENDLTIKEFGGAGTRPIPKLVIQMSETKAKEIADSIYQQLGIPEQKKEETPNA